MAERALSEYLRDVSQTREVRTGTPLPFGAHLRGDGVNFALFSRRATQVWLELYDRPQDQTPHQSIALDPAKHRCAFRRAHPVLRREAFYTEADIRWHSPQGGTPNWFDPHQRCLACHLMSEGEADLYMMFNAGSAAATFALPALPPAQLWHVAADTFRRPLQDVCKLGEELRLDDQRAYQVGPRSSVILLAPP